MNIKIIREEDFLNNRKVIREEDYLDELKSIEKIEIEDIAIPTIKHIPVSSDVSLEDDEEKKLRIMYNILELKGTDYEPTDEEIEELLMKSVSELEIIYEKLKEEKVKIRII